MPSLILIFCKNSQILDRKQTKSWFTIKNLAILTKVSWYTVFPVEDALHQCSFNSIYHNAHYITKAVFHPTLNCLAIMINSTWWKFKYSPKSNILHFFTFDKCKFQKHQLCAILNIYFSLIWVSKFFSWCWLHSFFIRGTRCCTKHKPNKKWKSKSIYTPWTPCEMSKTKQRLANSK